MPNSLENVPAAPGMEAWPSGKRSGLYSPECVEEVFAEGRIAAARFGLRSLRAAPYPAI
jgi:hypothetical protein